MVDITAQKKVSDQIVDEATVLKETRLALADLLSTESGLRAVVQTLVTLVEKLSADIVELQKKNGIIN